MMSRQRALIHQDARLQFRYGIYYAYAFVLVFYVAALIWAGAYLPDWAPAIIIFTDPAVLGFFFVGAIMMLEKAENTRTALAITPVSAADYLLAKTFTLTLMALVAVSILTFFLHTSANWLMLVGIVALSSVAFLGVGVATALHFKTVTSYLIGAAGYLVPIFIPAGLALYEHMPWWAILLPPASQFRLILVATGARSGSTLELAAMFFVALLTAIGGAWFAISRLQTELGSK